MGMIKIKNERFKDSGFQKFKLLPENPYSKFRTIQVKWYGKIINFDFATEQEARDVLCYLANNIPGFIQVGDTFIKLSIIKRYKVREDNRSVKLSDGTEYKDSNNESMKFTDDEEKFRQLVEFWDKTLEVR